MKFVAVAALIATVSAAGGDVCTDEDTATTCGAEADFCCGYTYKDEATKADVTRACSATAKADPSTPEEVTAGKKW